MAQPHLDLYSPKNGDRYTCIDGEWFRVCRYTHEWTRASGPPDDGRPCSNTAAYEAQARIDLY